MNYEAVTMLIVGLLAIIAANGCSKDSLLAPFLKGIAISAFLGAFVTMVVKSGDANLEPTPTKTTKP